MSVDNSKKCNRCGEIKLFIEFSLKKGGRHGRSAICKHCVNIYGRNHYQTHKDEKKIYCDKYRKENKSKIKKYYNDNREKLIQSNMDNYYKKKKSISDRRKVFYEKNKSKIKIERKHYYNANRERIRKDVNSRIKKRLESDDDYRMKTTIRNRFRAEIKRKYTDQKWRVMFGLTGYSAKDYIDMFDKDLFEKYKTTSDYHIDHIIPVSVYNFTIQEDINKCWNPKNLRIITKKENHTKTNKVDIDLIKKHDILSLLPEGFYEENNF